MLYLTPRLAILTVFAALLAASPAPAEARSGAVKVRVPAGAYQPRAYHPGKVAKFTRGAIKRLPRSLRQSRLAASMNARARGLKPDLVVLSDLHIGEGRIGKSRQYSNLEDFRIDQHFAKFTGYLVQRQARAGRKMELILAGDTMDFLKVETPPKGKSWPSKRPDRHTAPDEATAVLKAERIIQEHPRFFDSLGKLVGAGHRVTFLAGNHDQELNFPGVQAALRRAVKKRAPGSSGGQVRFNPWLRAVGKAVVEHGQRYDSMNNLSNPLHPFNKVDGKKRLRSAAGNYMVSHVVNPMKQSIQGFDHMRPSVKSVFRVLKHLPKALKRTGHMAGQIADNGGPPRPEEAAAQRRGHRQVLERDIARELAPAVRNNLKRRGRGRASTVAVLNRLRQFDALSPEPYMEGLDLKGSKWRRRLQLFKPSQIKRWTRYMTLHNTLKEGQEFALDKLGFDAHLSGHTHRPSHASEQRGGRDTHRVDTGTWTPRGTGKAMSRDGQLTFAEVRQEGGNMKVLLRRWAPERETTLRFKPAEKKRRKR